VAAAACLLLAGTLGVAALAKLADRPGFQAALGAVAPPQRARWLAVAVPVAELLLALALVTGAGGRVAPAAALLLLIAFSAVLARGVPCRCFGSETDPGAARVRNVLLGGIALALIAWPPGPLWAIQPEELAGAGTVATGLACAWFLARALEAQRA
jgi:uncharacterized membrane protein YphA (DoxX/SURF4 family)